MIKLKLGGAQDLDCVRAVRSVLPTVPLFVDVNAGWSLERLNRLAPDLGRRGRVHDRAAAAAGRRCPARRL